MSEPADGANSRLGARPQPVGRFFYCLLDPCFIRYSPNKMDTCIKLKEGPVVYAKQLAASKQLSWVLRRFLLLGFVFRATCACL